MAPCVAVPGAFHLVGREPELAALQAAVGEVAGGATRFVALSGEPGIGKTALLEALVPVAADAGLLVLRGRAAEQDRDVPFGLAVDALDDAVAALHASRVAALPGELAAVLPAVAGTGATAVPAAQRFRLHRALRDLLEELAGPAPLALVLDDLHWADEASLEWVLHALRRPARAAHLLVVALRAVEPLPRVLEAGRGLPGIQHLQIGPLPDADAARLLGEVGDAQRRRILAEAGGNPLFLDGLSRTAADGAFLPPDVAAVVQLETRALPPASRALLDGAAVAGDPFDFELAAAAAGLDDAAAALDRLVAADLVRATGDGLRFRHPLVRRAVYDAAPPGWRRHAHARAAEALAARGAPPVALAHHVEQSARVGDAAAAATLAAAATASAGSAPATAGRWWSAALRLQPGAGPDERLRLLLGLAEAEAGAGRHAEAHAALVEAVGMLDGRPAGLRSEVVAITAAAEHLLGLHEQATRRLRDELELAGPENPSLAARLRFELAVGALHASDLDALDQLAGRSAAELRATEPALAAADEAMAVVAAAWNGRRDDVPGALASARSSFAELTREQLAQRPEAAYFAGFAELLTEHVREGDRRGRRRPRRHPRRRPGLHAGAPRRAARHGRQRRGRPGDRTPVRRPRRGRRAPRRPGLRPAVGAVGPGDDRARARRPGGLAPAGRGGRAGHGPRRRRAVHPGGPLQPRHAAGRRRSRALRRRRSSATPGRTSNASTGRGRASSASPTSAPCSPSAARTTRRRRPPCSSAAPPSWGCRWRSAGRPRPRRGPPGRG